MGRRAGTVNIRVRSSTCLAVQVGPKISVFERCDDVSTDGFKLTLFTDLLDTPPHSSCVRGLVFRWVTALLLPGPECQVGQWGSVRVCRPRSGVQSSLSRVLSSTRG